MIRTSTICSSLHHRPGASAAPGEKSLSEDKAIGRSRGPEHQDRYRRSRPGISCAVHAYRSSEARRTASRRIDRGITRRARHGRYRLRRRSNLQPLSRYTTKQGLGTKVVRSLAMNLMPSYDTHTAADPQVLTKSTDRP